MAGNVNMKKELLLFVKYVKIYILMYNRRDEYRVCLHLRISLKTIKKKSRKSLPMQIR